MLHVCFSISVSADEARPARPRVEFDDSTGDGHADVVARKFADGTFFHNLLNHLEASATHARFSFLSILRKRSGK